jgi:hypothetical protein
MKNLFNGALAATFILVVSVTILSCAAGGRSSSPVLLPWTKGNGDSSNTNNPGSGPKANILCFTKECFVVTSHVDSATAATLPQLTIRFVTARRIRKNKTITLAVAIDHTSCPCCK